MLDFNIFKNSLLPQPGLRSGLKWGIIVHVLQCFSRNAANCLFDYLLLFYLVTGASFIVFSGALKPSSPFMAKVNIVEGLLPVFTFPVLSINVLE